MVVATVMLVAFEGEIYWLNSCPDAFRLVQYDCPLGYMSKYTSVLYSQLYNNIYILHKSHITDVNDHLFKKLKPNYDCFLSTSRDLIESVILKRDKYSMNFFFTVVSFTVHVYDVLFLTFKPGERKQWVKKACHIHLIYNVPC